MPRGKVTVEERVEAAKACAEGKMSLAEAGRRLGLKKKTVERLPSIEQVAFRLLYDWFQITIKRLG